MKDSALYLYYTIWFSIIYGNDMEVSMTDPYDIEVTVISQKGACGEGYKVGDSWIIGSRTPEGMCMHAFGVLLPIQRVLRYGGEFPWEKDKNVTLVVCLDVENPVVFKLRRIR
jgi:uncharacterized repeat protein (TIGR04076 family)